MSTEEQIINSVVPVDYNFEDLYGDYQNTFHKAQASIGSPDRSFVGWNGSTSVRSTYTKSDYNYFRSNSRKTSRGDILRVCKEAYKRVGIIQNVINLMSDFGSKGIYFRHKDEKTQKILDTWSQRIKLGDRSERFLNSFYKLGTVIIWEIYGRSEAGNIKSKYIPIEYKFLDPMSVRIKEEGEQYIPDKPTYELLQYASDNDRILNRESIAAIPEELKDRQYKTLNSEKLNVYNYRKDDWEFWGTPITYCILDQLEMLEKLQLADISALDGAISQVRQWIVGVITDNPQTTIIPTKPMLEKWAGIISQSVGGGTMDIVSGPEISFKESSTSVHQFLGEAKYKPVMDAIYDALGIPSSLRSSNKEGSSSNPISLKTLIERLCYGRMMLVDFWTKQIKKLFKALGMEDTQMPVIEFDYMVLTDEAAEKKLLIDLIDRDVVDDASVLERFNFDPEIVEKRLKKQSGGEMPEKAGPFHNPHVKDDMKKTLLANQTAAPHEVGLNIDVPTEEQKKRFTMTPKEQKKSNTTPATMGKTRVKKASGRPKNQTETKKRNKKGMGKAKASLNVTVWAGTAQKQISDIFTPIALSVYNKKNVRSLTVQETESLEVAKAKILFNIDPFQEINQESIAKAMANAAKTDLINELKEIQNETQTAFGRELTVEEKRNIISLFYTEVNNGEDSSDV